MNPTTNAQTGNGLLIALIALGIAAISIAVVVVLVLARKKKPHSVGTSDESSDKLGAAEIRVLLTLSDDAVVVTTHSLNVINYNARFRELLGASIIMSDQDLGTLLKMQLNSLAYAVLEL